jgi:UDP-N-acetylglucosamine 2-epimerase (non-hydrolysing)
MNEDMDVKSTPDVKCPPHRPVHNVTCVVVAYGTRPERIKLAPVVDALRERGVDVVEWCSGQQRDLAGSSEHGMRKELWEAGLTCGIANCLDEFEKVVQRIRPACVIVQGDTATAFACAQAAFLARVPVAHVEAGLRTYASEPWPEEAFRRQIAAVATWHFCPDEIAANNVRSETCAPMQYLIPKGTVTTEPIYPGKIIFETESNVWSIAGNDNVHVVGNTAIDTLPPAAMRVLVTLHRRENWGARIERALDVLHEVDACVEVIQHPNWNSWMNSEPAERWPKLAFHPPTARERMLIRLRIVDLVVTDSGGLQEEAAHFGTPCLVLRTSTERTALERAGAVTLVHPDKPERLRAALDQALAKRRCYGDGSASEQIADILVRELENA